MAIPVRVVAVLCETYPYNGRPSNILFAGKPAAVHWANAASALACGCLDVPHRFPRGAFGPGVADAPAVTDVVSMVGECSGMPWDY